MVPDHNPFIFNRPVDPADLIDREAEALQLLDLAQGGHATRLSAPRRFGKTSLLRRVLADADRIGMACVEVDFYGVLSRADVVARIEEAYRDLRPPLRRMAVAAIRTLRPRAGIGAGPVRIEAGIEPQADITRQLTGLLDLPLSLMRRSGKRTLVAFDEFQSLLEVDPKIDGLFRSHIQRHGDAASYIFAGSHPGLMNQLFGRRERPFFGQARAVHLDPLPDSDLADYIGERFELGGRDAGEALEPLLNLAAGHPQRAMLLAHHLWEQTPRGEAATAETWQATVDATFLEVEEALQATWDALEPKEQAVVAALALGDDTLFSRRTLARFNLTKGGARHARDRLLGAGHLHKVGTDARLVDPLLGAWLARWRPEKKLSLPG